MNQLEQRVEIVHQKAVAGAERQLKLDEAVEKLNCRPQVEIDSSRVKKETETRLIRKETGTWKDNIMMTSLKQN